MQFTQVNIFIIHYTKLTQREVLFSKLQTVLNGLLRTNPDLRVGLKTVSKFDPEGLTPEFMQRICDSSEFKEPEKAMYNKYIFKNPGQNIVSNCLKHMDAYNYIAKNTSDDDVNIIVEDDVVFDSSFESKLVKFIKQKMYAQSDIIFFGLPSTTPMKDSIMVDVVAIDDTSSILPCCDSYFISKKTATAFTTTYIPIKFPHNIQLSYLIHTQKCKVAKTFPNLMADGSKVGTSPSTISPNNILIFNSTYKTVYKLLEKPDPTNEDIKTIGNLLEENKFKESPDFIFLEGLFFMRTKRYDMAKTLFDKAIASYEANHSPLNNHSALIQNYVDLCKYTQS